jgi:hypothetical protein
MTEVNSALEVWKTTLAVQQHFNELSLRVRSIAVTVLGGFLAVAGYALKERATVEFMGRQISLTGAILLAALLCWGAFYVMDRLWYHRLLRAAVQHGRAVEDQLRSAIPTIGLTTTIDEASPIWGLRAGHRLSIFYGFIAVVLWIGAGTALRASSPYFLVGVMCLLVTVTFEMAARADTAQAKRRGLIRAGLLAAVVYFGWWALLYSASSSAEPQYLQLSREAADKLDWHMSGVWMGEAMKMGDEMMESGIWGILVPIIALFIGGIVFWMYRGFRDKHGSKDGAA